MARRRTINKRSGEECDYSALAVDAERLARRKGISRRSAVEKIAERANDEKLETVVSGINRVFADRKKGTHAIAGLGGISRAARATAKAISDRFTEVHRFAAPAYCGELIEELETLLDLLDVRASALKSATPAAALKPLRLAIGAPLPTAITPEALIQAELEEIEASADFVRSTQRVIQGAKDFKESNFGEP